ncbi:MAG: DUF4398 domain-containing protein [Gammaproteobacteria bacterium]|nr:DUF4398 domain-containing protein [Gammaproteobacteria bacterium]
MGPIGAAVAVLLVLSGCAHAPSQEMSDARRAIRAAVEAGAREDASWTLARAEEAMVVAGAALERGDYDFASRHAGSAARNAHSSRRIALAIQSARTAINTVAPDEELQGVYERALDAAAKGNEADALAFANAVRVAVKSGTR